MRPVAFAYRDPRTLEEALTELGEWGSEASILAGGQSLVPLLNMRLALPEMVLDINRVAGLDTLQVDSDVVRVGALVRARTLELDTEVARVLPVLVEGVRHIAHPQIRTRTTVGGSISHADPSSELPAILAALGGSVELTSLGGSRTVGWNEFFVTVFTTSREPEELLTSVNFPVPVGFRFCFLELARRHGEYPVAGLCVGTRTVDGSIAEARLAAIGVGTGPARLRGAEQALIGADPEDPRTHRAAADIAAGEVQPNDDIHGSAAYRRAVLQTLVRRALASLGRKGEGS